MPSELHSLLINQLTPHQKAFELPDKEYSHSHWKSRPVSKTNSIWSQIKQIIIHKDHDDMDDTQLLNRVCALCNINTGQKETLKAICADSTEKAAKALADIIINVVQNDKKSAEAFYNSLQAWAKQGGGFENRATAVKEIIHAYEENTTMLSLKALGLETLPDALNQLVDLEKINCANNNLSQLPNVFASLPKLSDINLDNNPFDIFPNTLYTINTKLDVNIENTPILNSLMVPSLQLKISENDWTITGTLKNKTSSIFNIAKEHYLDQIQTAKDINIRPIDYMSTQHIINNNDLADEVQDVLIAPYHHDKERIRNHKDFQAKLTSYSFANFRFIPCGDTIHPFNVFGCAHPPMHPKGILYSETKMKQYLQNLSFVFNEINTMIVLVERSLGFNKPNTFVTDCAGNKTLHPTKVLSMPIQDLYPPRFTHYLKLTEEMHTPLSHGTPKGILLFCNAGAGRTGTLLAATQLIDEFKKRDSEARKQLLLPSREYTPKTFGGSFKHLNHDFKTTVQVGQIVQNLRQLEQETTANKVGISVETPAQFQTLELFQCMLGISEKLNGSCPISDKQILDIINMHNFKLDILEYFFQIDYNHSAQDIILDSIKKLHITLSKT